MVDVRVPALGESVTEATIGKWFKQPGEAVAVDEPLVELETDKVTIEVPAPAAGVLANVAAKDGETVAVGALLGNIQEGAQAAGKTGAASLGWSYQKTDTTVPIKHSELMEAALKKAGVLVKLVRLPGGGHGPAFFRAQKDWPDFQAETVRWFDQHLQKK